MKRNFKPFQKFVNSLDTSTFTEFESYSFYGIYKKDTKEMIIINEFKKVLWVFLDIEPNDFDAQIDKIIEKKVSVKRKWLKMGKCYIYEMIKFINNSKNSKFKRTFDDIYFADVIEVTNIDNRIQDYFIV